MSNMICLTDLYDDSDMIVSKEFIRTVLPHERQGDGRAYFSVVRLKDDSKYFVKESVRTINDLLRV